RHHKSGRVDGHIFISILAYHLLHSIEYSLKKSQDQSRWATIRRLVSTHEYATIQLPTTQGTVINVRKPSNPEAIHIEVYEKLAVDYKVLPVQRTFA
ncbi:transposase, partial [bacterium]|nr:transposase [bacterium]